MTSFISYTNNNSNVTLFPTGEIVLANGLEVAKHLNGLRGEVMGKPDAATGRIPVRFALDNALTTKLILPSNLEKLPDKDDPRVGYLRKDEGNEETTDIVLIENGNGKRCVTCGCNLDGRYHLKLENEAFYCEEHYVSKYIGCSVLNRFCAICHKHISLRDGARLPPDVFEKVFPSGVLADGTKVSQDSPDGESDKCIWAHKKCFSCSSCKRMLSDARVAKRGFNISVDPANKMVNFYCVSAAGATTGCDKELKEYSAAKERLQSIRKLSVEEMHALLKDRNVATSKKDTHSLLVRKIVATENQGIKVNKQKHIVTFFDKKGEEFESRKVVGCTQPGHYFLDRFCSHGSQGFIDDAPMQSMKRSLVNDYMFTLVSNFDEKYLCSGNDTQIAPGIVITPLDNSTAAAVKFFTHPDRYSLLQSDTKERFVPKKLWALAINGACDEDGAEDYTRLNLCGSLIAHAILDVVHAKHPELPSDLDFFQLFGPPSAPLKILLQKVTKSTSEMYQFMDISKHRPCDCMQYVAIAASMDLLRNKPLKVKPNKV